MHAARALVSQRFVWPLRVEFSAHAVKPRLLLPRRPGGRRRRLLLQRQMKALVTPVLFRVPRSDPIELNPQLEPPHRQLGELRRPRRRERRAVVGAEGPRDAQLTKTPLKPRPQA